MAEPPRVVRAKGPNGDQIRLALCSETWNQAIQGGDRWKAGQYLGLIQTGPPHLDASVGLLRAHALWQGLKRPLGSDRSGPHHYAYIIRSPVSYVVVQEDGAHQVLPDEPPPSSVFMVNVELPPEPESDPRVLRWRAFASDDVVGLVEDWMWVKRDKRQPDQPHGPARRFDFRHW